MPLSSVQSIETKWLQQRKDPEQNDCELAGTDSGAVYYL